ncbi:MAG: hypothetical protein AAF525_08565 [Pseudomonadota bacterium]
MTARNSLKRRVRARMRKTGESYASALRAIRDGDIAMQHETSIWPSWTRQHPWLRGFLEDVELEAVKRGDLRCDHIHLQIAFLRLGLPVSQWLEELSLNRQNLIEELVEMIGMNAARAAGDNQLDGLMARADRVANQTPVTAVDSYYTNEILHLARNEAARHHENADARHLLIGLGSSLFQGAPPTPDRLRKVAALPIADIRDVGDERISHQLYQSKLAASHGKSSTEFPYDTPG